MNGINKFISKIPEWLSSKVSIFIYFFLFCYLVIMAIIGFVIPALSFLRPSQDAQLVLGNYTNVLSALGASIAAGSGVAIHKHIKEMHEGHKKMQETIDNLHEKLDKLSGIKNA